VPRLLDHPTLRSIHVSEYHRIRSGYLYAEMALSPTDGRSLKQITIEGKTDVDCGVALTLNHLQGRTTVNAVVLRELREAGGSLNNGVSALLMCNTMQIKKLVLRKCRVTEDIWIQLRSVLKANVAVTKLELSKCKFDNEATTDFVRSVGSVVSSVCFPSDEGSGFGELTLANMYNLLLFARDNPLKNLEMLHD
jgi:hypothetical protein